MVIIIDFVNLSGAHNECHRIESVAESTIVQWPFYFGLR